VLANNGLDEDARKKRPRTPVSPNVRQP